MNDQPAKLDAAKGSPSIEITIGQLNFGKYKIDLWDETGRNPKEIAKGTNVDNIPDTFPIAPTPATANKQIVSWEVLLASYKGGEDSPYSVTINVLQQGEVVPNGRTVQSGKLTSGAALVFGGVRLVVA